MTYRIDRFDTQEDLNAALAEMPTYAASRAMQVTAYEQVAEYGEPDPETGEADMIVPAILADGFWLLRADPEGVDPLALPQGLVAISPLFAGMAEPENMRIED